MANNLDKILSENTNLPADVQKQINEAWESKLIETRESVAAELREEFARKHNHDKSVLAEAVDKFLTDRISVELEEFAEDKRKLAEDRVQYKTQLTEHTNILDQFIAKQVAKEVKELRADKVKMSESFKKLENFLLKQLSEEIREFRSDKRELVSQKVKMVSEGKKHLAQTKQQFVQRAAKVVNETINSTLKSEINQFKDDISVARDNEFGRRIFETFASEYAVSYLNEGSELKKLRKVIENNENELNTIKETVAQKETVVEGLQSDLNVANDRIVRNRKMGALLKPLAGEKRKVMVSLLESVETKNLDKSFNKYLPSVLNESAPVAQPKASQSKEKLSESVKTEKTGNRAHAHQDSAANDLAQLKILAGLK